MPRWPGHQNLPCNRCGLRPRAAYHKLCDQCIDAHPLRPDQAPVEQRFFRHVDCPRPIQRDLEQGAGPCWLWTGATSRGRPVMRDENSMTRSARVVGYVVVHGARPTCQLRPTCGQALCVNPGHMLQLRAQAPAAAP